jgi:hypothetical protein
MEAQPFTTLFTANGAIISLRRWLNATFTPTPIQLERSVGAFARPAFRIERVPTALRHQYTRQITQALYLLKLWYFDKEREKVEEMIAQVEWRLTQNLVLPYYLRDWTYPSPTLVEVPDAGTDLAAGTYSVVIEGKTLLGDWSLASTPVSLVIGAGSKVRAVLPMVTSATPYFTEYRVYTGPVEGGEGLLTTVTPLPGRAVEVELSALGTGAGPTLIDPDAPHYLPYDWMRVHLTSAGDVMEDKVAVNTSTQETVYDGVLTLRCSMVQSRESVQRTPMTGVSKTVRLSV